MQLSKSTKAGKAEVGSPWLTLLACRWMLLPCMHLACMHVAGLAFLSACCGVYRLYVVGYMVVIVPIMLYDAHAACILDGTLEGSILGLVEYKMYPLPHTP